MMRAERRRRINEEGVDQENLSLRDTWLVSALATAYTSWTKLEDNRNH